MLVLKLISQIGELALEVINQLDRTKSILFVQRSKLVHLFRLQ